VDFLISDKYAWIFQGEGLKEQCIFEIMTK